jgi:hypothetical protein
MPLALPHKPLTDGPGGLGAAILFAAQESTLPPFEPEQDHTHGPSPLTPLGVPPLHKPSEGAAFRLAPLDVPQMPSILSGFDCKDAAQLTSLPPPLPAHVHIHGPSPVMPVGAPEEHKPAKGADLSAAPLAGPHEPSTIFFVSHETLRLPLLQVQRHGFDPRTALALPP